MFRRKAKKTPRPLRAATHIFHGVAVKGNTDACCQAASEILGDRYLAEDAPMLPLEACTDPQNCKCVYEHFDDRRTGVRRASDEGLPRQEVADDARKGDGRRVTDG